MRTTARLWTTGKRRIAGPPLLLALAIILTASCAIFLNLRMTVNTTTSSAAPPPLQEVSYRQRAATTVAPCPAPVLSIRLALVGNE